MKAFELNVPKVLLVDFDGVISDLRSSDPAKRKINPQAMERVAQLANAGYRIAFITGREGSQLFGEGSLFESLKKYGIEDKVLVYGARGLYLVRPDRTQAYTPEGERFLGQRDKITKFFKDQIAEHNENILLDNSISEAKQNEMLIKVKRWEKEGAHSGMLQLWYEPVTEGMDSKARASRVRGLENVIRIIAHRLELHYDLRLEIQRVGNEGVNILPEAASKAVGMRNAIKALVLESRVVGGEVPAYFIGRAFGDSPEDLNMAKHRRVKFVHVKNPQEFIKNTRFLAARMFHQGGRRPLFAAAKWANKAIKRFKV
ncbi:MAG TPA: hypothetical protein VFF09_04300 [archaeon]|nr:hypothetical protein [archaeon]